jgi:tRNA A-37 threonylcarbamoyl transferase component Bud32
VRLDAPLIVAWLTHHRLLPARRYLSGSGSSPLSPLFSGDQFAFLQNLDTLDVTESDFDAQAACQTNNTQQLRGTIQVCLTSAATATTTDEATATSHTWKVVLLAVAGAVLVLGLLALAVCVWRRRRRAAKYITAELDDPQLAPLMLKPGDIKNVRKIGDGAHCVVWLVKYRKTQLLASKRLRKDLTRRRITKAFIEEIKLTAPLDHPSVVKLVGIAWTVKTDIQVLFEYVDNGNVNDYLTRPGTLHEWTQEKLQIALEVAEALVYLHSFAPPVLHRDLRASNVLLTSGMKAKVSKVGVSHLRTIGDGDKEQPAVLGGPWQAPEVLMGADARDPAVDIFSFGVLLSELDTHAPPYNDARTLSGAQLADAVVLQMIAAGSIRLRFGDDCPSDLRSLADSCLAKNPRTRPAASELVYALRTIKKLV